MTHNPGPIEEFESIYFQKEIPSESAQNDFKTMLHEQMNLYGFKEIDLHRKGILSHGRQFIRQHGGAVRQRLQQKLSQKRNDQKNENK